MFLRLMFLVISFLFISVSPLLAEDLAAPKSSPLDASTSDGLAKVHKIKGHAVLTQKGSPVEKILKTGDIIEAGDTIFTGKGSGLTISFDRDMLNVVHLPADSKVTFTSIEPTEIKTETGSVFNVVDGLAQGSTWKVVTPSMVAAVRGTVFMTTFVNGEFYAATLNVPDDEKNSMITVQSLVNASLAKIFEGQEIDLKGAEEPGQAAVRALNPATVAGLLAFFQEVLSERPQLAEDTSAALEVLSESREVICDASGKNCSTKVCKQTAGGEVCSYV